jgi:GntR family transcriptional repressor for pyruvate dehydrogenase complex
VKLSRAGDLQQAPHVLGRHSAADQHRRPTLLRDEIAKKRRSVDRVAFASARKHVGNARESADLGVRAMRIRAYVEGTMEGYLGPVCLGKNVGKKRRVDPAVCPQRPEDEPSDTKAAERLRGLEDRPAIFRAIAKPEIVRAHHRADRDFDRRENRGNGPRRRRETASIERGNQFQPIGARTLGDACFALVGYDDLEPASFARHWCIRRHTSDVISKVRRPFRDRVEAASGKVGSPMALTDEAIEKIKDMIVSGELRPGDRLPKEPDLAAHLGLSRNSLREAVRALSLIRVLDVRQGDGTYVTSLEPALLLDALKFVLDFHRDQSILQLFEVRRILEPAAVAMAATRMTDEAIAELAQTLRRATPDAPMDQFVEADVEFHRQLATGSGNPVLCSIIDGLVAPTTRARIWRGLTQEKAVERSVHEHRMIYESVAARDPERAKSWATIHISGVEDWLRNAFSEHA